MSHSRAARTARLEPSLIALTSISPPSISTRARGGQAGLEDPRRALHQADQPGGDGREVFGGTSGNVLRQRQRDAVRGYHDRVRDIRDPRREVGDQPAQVLAVCVINDPLLLRARGPGPRPGELRAGTRSAGCGPTQVIAAAAARPASAPRRLSAGAAGAAAVRAAAAARGAADEVRLRDTHGQPGDRAVAADRIGDDLGGVPAFSPRARPGWRAAAA